MLIKYGSFMYFFYIFLALGICAALYFIFRKRSMFAKKMLVFSLMGINFLQHIFKFIIYKPYRSVGFSYADTIYNMCAFLIITAPFFIAFGGKLLKDFTVYVGSFAGMIAILVPYWYIGLSAFGWEQFRFYLCHTLLFVSSMLVALLGIHKPTFKNFYKIPFLFFFALIIIIINDIITIALGIYEGRSIYNLYAELSNLNPVWSFHPNEGFGWLEKIISVFTPNVFLGNADKVYVPILWYAIPVYLFITILVFIVGAIVDRENFKDFLEKCKVLSKKILQKCKAFCRKTKELFEKCKTKIKNNRRK